VKNNVTSFCILRHSNTRFELNATQPWDEIIIHNANSIFKCGYIYGRNSLKYLDAFNGMRLCSPNYFESSNPPSAQNYLVANFHFNICGLVVYDTEYYVWIFQKFSNLPSASHYPWHSNILVWHTTAFKALKF